MRLASSLAITTCPASVVTTVRPPSGLRSTSPESDWRLASTTTAPVSELCVSVTNMTIGEPDSPARKVFERVTVPLSPSVSPATRSVTSDRSRSDPSTTDLSPYWSRISPVSSWT